MLGFLAVRGFGGFVGEAFFKLLGGRGGAGYDGDMITSSEEESRATFG